MTGARHGIAPTCTRPTHGPHGYHPPQGTPTRRTRVLTRAPALLTDGLAITTWPRPCSARTRLGSACTRPGLHTARPGPALTRAWPSHSARACPPSSCHALTAVPSTRSLPALACTRHGSYASRASRAIFIDRLRVACSSRGCSALSQMQKVVLVDSAAEAIVELLALRLDEQGVQLTAPWPQESGRFILK
jgi:hypothetical protein